jgi:oligopeptide transport system substrate-binding protein
LPERKARLAAILLCALLIFLPSCGRKTNSTTAVRTLRYPILFNIATLDPATCFNVENWEVVENIFEGLVGYDVSGKIVPRLAETWEVSEGARRYIFHLRKDAKFHNGRRMTAADVKYSLERALWPETKSPAAANYLAGITGLKEVTSGKRKDLPGIRVVDDATVEISLDKPSGYFLGQLTVSVACVVCREEVEKNGGRIDEHSAVGTGPFKLGQFQPGVQIIFDANRSYYGRQAGVDRVERRIILDSNTAHILYEAGEADILGISGVQYVQDKKDPRLAKEIMTHPTASNMYVVIHPRLQPAFKDVRVRQAFAEAINRDEAVRLAGEGTLTRVDTFLAPGVPGYQPDVRRFRYDPAHARQLLASAGYPGGKGFPRLTLVYIQKEAGWSAFAHVIRDGLKQNLGIEADLQEREAAVFNSDTNTKEIVPFYVFGWTADYLDPQNFLSTLLRTGAPVNRCGYSNPELDALCDKADIETDDRKRAALYAKADEIAMRDVAVLPIATGIGITLVKPTAHGFEANPICVLPLNSVTISPK